MTVKLHEKYIRFSYFVIWLSSFDLFFFHSSFNKCEKVFLIWLIVSLFGFQHVSDSVRQELLPFILQVDSTLKVRTLTIYCPNLSVHQSKHVVPSIFIYESSLPAILQNPRPPHASIAFSKSSAVFCKIFFSFHIWGLEKLLAAFFAPNFSSPSKSV